MDKETIWSVYRENRQTAACTVRASLMPLSVPFSSQNANILIITLSRFSLLLQSPIREYFPGIFREQITEQL